MPRPTFWFRPLLLVGIPVRRDTRCLSFVTPTALCHEKERPGIGVDRLRPISIFTSSDCCYVVVELYILYIDAMPLQIIIPINRKGWIVLSTVALGVSPRLFPRADALSHTELAIVGGLSGLIEIGAIIGDKKCHRNFQ